MANYRRVKILCALALALGVTASSLGIFAFAATHSSTASAPWNTELLKLRFNLNG